MGTVVRLKFAKRPTEVELLDITLDRVRAERARAHRDWRALDDEVHALMMKRYELVEASRK
jgi:hypothetical protein